LQQHDKPRGCYVKWNMLDIETQVHMSMWNLKLLNL
jgi:hypothetical protein